jgi:integrase
VLNLDELSRLVRSAPASVQDFLQLVACTGLRMGEALALRWQDVDLESGTVSVTGQLDRKTRQRGPTKTESGRREVFLSDNVVSTLKARRRKALERGLHGPERYVFCTRSGKPLGHRFVVKSVRLAGDSAGLNPEGMQPVSCHDLRHSFVSRLIANGVDPTAVAKLAGDKVSTIMDVYAHYYDEAKRSAELREKVALANTV